MSNAASKGRAQAAMPHSCSAKFAVICYSAILLLRTVSLHIDRLLNQMRHQSESGSPAQLLVARPIFFLTCDHWAQRKYKSSFLKKYEGI